MSLEEYANFYRSMEKFSENDVVHVYNPEFGVDYEALLIRLYDDGTALVRSESTGKEHSVEIGDLREKKA